MQDAKPEKKGPYAQEQKETGRMWNVCCQRDAKRRSLDESVVL
jgi:hypothetical protein